MIDSAFVQIDATATEDELVEALRAVTAGSPFEVTDVDRVGPSRYRCTFRVRHPDLAVGFRNVIDLQHRLDRGFHIVSVECRHRELVA